MMSGMTEARPPVARSTDAPPPAGDRRCRRSVEVLVRKDEQRKKEVVPHTDHADEQHCHYARDEEGNSDGQIRTSPAPSMRAASSSALGTWEAEKVRMRNTPIGLTMLGNIMPHMELMRWALAYTR